MNIDKCLLIKFPIISDDRGNLAFLEGNSLVPFDIKRIFYMYNIPNMKERGAHAHKILQQVIIPIAGSFKAILDDGKRKVEYHLNDPAVGLYTPAMIWTTLSDFSKDSVCLVLASEKYQESDYYRNYKQFLDAVI